MYYIGVFLTAFFGKYAIIKLGRKSRTLFEIFAFSFVTGLISSMFFFAMSKFTIAINSAVVIYSAIFATIVILVHFSNLLLYKYLEVSRSAILSNTFTMILTIVIGRVFLKENVDIYDIIRCLLLVAACIFPDIPLKKHTKNGRPFPFFGLAVVIFLSFLSVIASAMANRYSSDVRVTDSNSFFFLTNVFVVAYSGLIVVLVEKFNFASIKKQLASYSGKSFLMTVVSTVSSNLGSIFQMLIFAAGSGIILYTPISGALALVATGIISVMEKERPRIPSLVLACAALFVGLF